MLLASGTDSDAVGTTAVKTLTFSSAVPAGTLLAISCSMNGATSVLNSASDGHSNTYTVRSTSTFTSNTITNYIVLALITGAIAASDVLTLTWANARNRFAAAWGAFSDFPAATTLDGTTGAALGTSTTSSATSSDPAGWRILSLVGVGGRGVLTSWTAVAPYNQVGFISSDNTTTGRSAGLGYQYAWNPGALTATGTLNPSEQWATHVANVSVPYTVQPFRNVGAAIQRAAVI